MVLSTEEFRARVDAAVGDVVAVLDSVGPDAFPIEIRAAAVHAWDAVEGLRTAVAGYQEDGTSG